MSERKRIAVIVEWEGACGEWDWIAALSRDIEGTWIPKPTSRLVGWWGLLGWWLRRRQRVYRDSHCRATSMVPLTNFGTTEIQTSAEMRESILRIEGERDSERRGVVEYALDVALGKLRAALEAIDTDDRDDGCPYNSLQMREIARRALAGEEWGDV